ncbi:phosphonate ABC transporter, permease protein PhnE [Erysipelothrix inopinata]|uniref:Phosphonate ABC transporter, permease protein PhnE n=1 Tax=Erysipelothrix inopinata TaxID=225084 RepID=A0A7G9RYI6_9FIRM|nr:phosphonate ABC transporter, permease protein PhnE [Erysipelothrix inopinata]QNN60661.1 phosphonate ABC transporter, permease protein PhnE [Erysipelothrix inopinata]
MNPTVQTVYDNRPKKYKRIIFISLIVVGITLLSVPYVDYNGIVENGMDIVNSILMGILKPNWEVLFTLSKEGVPYLVFETVAIAFLGTFVGLVLSIPIAFLSSENIVSKKFSWIGTFVITVIRTFPPFVYGLMLIRVSGPGAFTGVLTLAITSIGMISKMFVEVIEDLDQGIIESLDASGCNTIQKIRYGIIPQLMGNFASISIYRFEINVKNASILGLVGAGGIGAPLLFAMSGFRWADAGALLWGLIILVVVVEALSSRIRSKLS